MLRKRHDDPLKDQSTLLDNGDSQGKSKMRRSHNKPRSLSKIVIPVIVFIFLFFTIIAPVVFRWSDPIRRGLLFMNWLSLPLFRNVSNPELEFGLNCTRNLYITSPDDKVKLGVWHVLPKDRFAECNLNTVEKLPANKAFNDNQPVVLYLHGNGGARGGNHRKELYKLLAYNDNLKYHIVAVDYRGYGDSTDLTPTSSGLVADAATVYDWLLTRLHGRNDRIIIWGHSLGTAVATYLVSQTDPLSQPSAVVLEAPFTTVEDAVRNHPLSTLFKKHPMFEYFFVEPLVKDEDTNFETAAKIRRVHCHLMILHAIDDAIVPYSLGQQLYQTALETRPPTAPPPKMVTFDGSHNYGHKGIFKDAQLPKIIADFVRSSATGKN